MSLILGLIIFLLLIEVAACFFFWRKRYIKRLKILIILCGLILFIPGGFMSLSRISTLQDNLDQKWIAVEGRVITSQVTGERAFHPEITYQYPVGDDTLTARTDLGMPGFGGRRNRLETSEIIARDNPPGRPITVYYDPANPTESTLRPGISYNIYMQLASGIVLMFGGLCLFMAVFSRKTNH